MSAEKFVKKHKINYPRVISTVLFALIFGTLALLTVLSVPSGGLAELFNRRAEDGYPYNLNGQPVIGLLAAPPGVQILSADGVILLDKKAREIYSRKLDYADPTAGSAFGHSLIADRADGRYFLHGKSGIVFEGKLQSPVTLAAVGKNNAALASQTAEGEARLDVLNKRGHSVFNWSNAGERIVSIALSQNGRYAAAALLRMEEGECYSRVLIFNISRKRIIAELDFEQSTLLRIRFTDRNNLYVLGEDLLACLKKDGSRVTPDTEFIAGQLERFTFSQNGRVALVLHGEENEMTLKAYDTRGNLSFEKITGAVSAMAMDGKYMAVLKTDSLEIYDINGDLIAKPDIGTDPVRAIILNKKTLYTLTNNSVEQFTF